MALTRTDKKANRKSLVNCIVKRLRVALFREEAFLRTVDFRLTYAADAWNAMSPSLLQRPVSHSIDNVHWLQEQARFERQLPNKSHLNRISLSEFWLRTTGH